MSAPEECYFPPFKESNNRPEVMKGRDLCDSTELCFWSSSVLSVGVMCDKTIGAKVKGMFYSMVGRSAMWYDLETVALTKRHDRTGGCTFEDVKIFYWY